MTPGGSSEKSSTGPDSSGLTLGIILRPHGIRGEVLVEANSELLASLRSGAELQVAETGRTEQVVSIRPHRKHTLIKFQGVTSRDQAEQLRSMTLVLALDEIPELPEGVYFRWQILGLRAIDEDSRELGRVVDILETGANDVYIIDSPDKGEILLPAIDTVILEVRLEEGEIIVRIPDGLLVD